MPFWKKSGFTKKELVNARWLKVGNHGYHFVVQFMPDGTLEEYNLFHPSAKEQGSWKIDENGTLHTQVLDYRLDIPYFNTFPIRLGKETRNGSHNANFQFIKLPPKTFLASQIMTDATSLLWADLADAWRVFGYETTSESKSFFWVDGDDAIQRSFEKGESLGKEKEFGKQFLTWINTKRLFVKQEMTGLWVKVSDAKNTRLVHFYPNGSLEELDLFETNKDNKWGGSWELKDGILNVSIGWYHLSVFGNKNDVIHSGVETKEGEITAYFKVIRIF